MINPRYNESGKVRATRELFGADQEASSFSDWLVCQTAMSLPHSGVSHLSVTPIMP
jgi:hypothetical protein